MKLSIYTRGSLLKLSIGLMILVTLYHTIYPQQDPGVALSLGFLGFFLSTRGGSYFLFYAYGLFISHQSGFSLTTQSYKLSLLFGLYMLINGILIIGGIWSRWVGLGLLIGFVGLQVFLARESKTADEQRY